MAPRYFTARPAAQAPPASALGNPVTHPLDVFVLNGPHGQAAEWVVGFDGLGALTAQPLAEAELSATVRTQLAFHEVAGGVRRQMTLGELHLFQLELVEQAPQSPGFDDPVHLYGTLLGPLSPIGAANAVEGLLTVTRADLLEGAAQGARNAFRYGGPGTGSAQARAFHFLLPADRADEIERGHGVVLAYPVLSADLHTAAPGNEYFFNQILYDVITALWSDVQAEAPPPRRRPGDVPVPNRAIAEQRLVSEGFTIHGDQALRRREGMLGSMLGSLVEERRDLPTEGHSDDYLRLAAEALTAIKGWPAPRARALRSCLGAAPNLGRMLGGAPRVTIATPPVSPLPPPPAPPRHRAGPPAWMEDFIASHTPPGGPPRIVTGAAAPAPRRRRASAPASASSETPAWMSDFAKPEKNTPQDELKEPPSKPDWTKDFDS